MVELAKKDIRFGVLVSSTDTLAGLIFDLYKTELEDNNNFKHDFNITLPGTWREKELVIDIDGHIYCIFTLIYQCCSSKIII